MFQCGRSVIVNIYITIVRIFPLGGICRRTYVYHYRWLQNQWIRYEFYDGTLVEMEAEDLGEVKIENCSIVCLYARWYLRVGIWQGAA
ncbi:hypothetical protein Hdeb2414_s0022g00610611 [Helianthus debilis subsp. tardiflorus]